LHWAAPYSDNATIRKPFLEHNLFLCPFVTHFGFCSFGLDLGSSLFVLPFSLCWVLCCLMELARFHSQSFVKGKYKLTCNNHRNSSPILKSDIYVEFLNFCMYV
jgi:hypothetical protein